MKLITIFLIVAIHVSAKGVAQITLSEKNAPLEKVFKAIEKQSGYVFFYDYAWLQESKTVSIQVKNASLAEVLNSCFKDQPLTYSIIGKTIVLKQKEELKRESLPIVEKPITINLEVSGTITDIVTGKPLAGATVKLKGSNQATTTDENGNFTLQVPGEGSVLVFSYVGYETIEVTISKKEAALKIALRQKVFKAEEIVVIGYGTQQKKDVTGAVTSVPMENIKGMAVSGIDQALSGQVSGLQVNTSNGIPGGGPQVQLRGVGAIGATSQPLYVVDGFALSSTSDQISNPMNDIAPQDIESINVLKDASATAIYGSRGANGVIIITTKKGTSGIPKLQVSAYTGVQVIPQHAKPNLMDATEFAEFKKESISDQILANTGVPATIDQIPEIYRNPELLGKGTNWFDVITQVAPMSDFNFSLSGGNEKVRTYLSASYLKQDGVVLTTGYERYSLRVNVDANLSHKLKVGINLAPTFSKRKKPISGGNGRNSQGFGESEVASPIPPVYNADGTYNAMISEDPSIFPYPNPLMALEEVDDNSQNMRILSNAFGEYDILDHLKIRSTINVDWQDGVRDFFHPSTVGYLFQYPPTIPTAFHGTSSNLNLLNENTLTYQNSFGNGHSITALVGYSIQYETDKSSGFTGDKFPDDNVRTFNAAATITGSTSVEEWGLVSYLARLNYSYKDRYLVTATMRRDGSSRFGKDNLWGDFPSVALGWHVSQESFMKNVSWLSDLKLRASYGRSGNFQIGNYTSLSHIVSSNYVLGGSLVGGRIMSTLGNNELGWEKMGEINLGVDIGLLQNRVFITMDAYKRNTESLLLDAELPRSSGFSSAIENHGNLENKGFELAISSRNIVRKNFSWNTDFNISFNKNKVLALGPTNAPILAGSSYEGNPTNITMVGKPLGMFYGFVFDGIYQNQAEVDRGPAFPGAVPGNMRVKDINGDGIITDVQDFAIIGNPYPKFIWGITNNLTYKNFDLRVSATSQIGGHRISSNDFSIHLLDGLFNVSRDLINRWRSPSQPGNGKVPTTNGTGYGRRMYRDANSLFVQNNSYFWIKNITIGYSIPNGIAKGVIKRARFYASIQNGLLFTNYRGNPEVTSYVEGGSALAPGYDSNPYPVPVNYSVGMNLTF